MADKNKKVTMGLIKKQVNELIENQNHILVAIKNLDGRLKEPTNKENDKESIDVRDILESQVMIDQIIVKNSDDILVMKKTKDENTVAIKVLETQIEKINEEIKQTEKRLMVNDVRKSTHSSEIKCEASKNTLKNLYNIVTITIMTSLVHMKSLVVCFCTKFRMIVSLVKNATKRCAQKTSRKRTGK